MSEMIWCNITVRTPDTWGDNPDMIPGCALLKDYLNETDYDVVLEGTTYTWSFAGDGNYGLSADAIAEALQWFVENGVPYYATSDPKYEFEGETDMFDGKEFYERTSATEGCIVLSEHTFRKIVAEWAHAPVGALEAITAYFTLPDFSKVSTAHLPAQCPGQDEEE